MGRRAEVVFALILVTGAMWRHIEPNWNECTITGQRKIRCQLTTELIRKIREGAHSRFADLKNVSSNHIGRRQRVIGSRPLVRSATHLERHSSAYIGLTDDPYV
jgi:hypothetical protein